MHGRTAPDRATGRRRAGDGSSSRHARPPWSTTCGHRPWSSAGSSACKAGASPSTSRILDHCLDEWNTTGVRFESPSPRGAPCRAPPFNEGEEMSTDVRESTARKLFVGGSWTDAESGDTFEDRDPYTGDVVAEVAAGT